MYAGFLTEESFSSDNCTHKPAEKYLYSCHNNYTYRFLQADISCETDAGVPSQTKVKVGTEARHNAC